MVAGMQAGGNLEGDVCEQKNGRNRSFDRFLIGSPGRIRTAGQVINSHLLYR